MFIRNFFYIYLQNGNIFVFTGMLNICTTDDELGMVLGHEISHCLLGHAVRFSLHEFSMATRNCCLLV